VVIHCEAIHYAGDLIWVADLNAVVDRTAAIQIWMEVDLIWAAGPIVVRERIGAIRISVQTLVQIWVQIVVVVSIQMVQAVHNAESAVPLAAPIEVVPHEVRNVVVLLVVRNAVVPHEVLSGAVPFAAPPAAVGWVRTRWPVDFGFAFQLLQASRGGRCDLARDAMRVRDARELPKVACQLLGFELGLILRLAQILDLALLDQALLDQARICGLQLPGLAQTLGPALSELSRWAPWPGPAHFSERCRFPRQQQAFAQVASVVAGVALDHGRHASVADRRRA